MLFDTKAREVTTNRLRTRVLTAGAEDGVPVIFVHGNLSSATWWAEVMSGLPDGFRAIAPDLRGYGGADPAALTDATRGMGDYSDDLAALMGTLGLKAAHMVGHSLGGGVLWRFLADHPTRVLSLTQVAPASPYGFGATKPDGSPAFPDGAGAGAGAVNPDFARRLAEGDRSAEAETSPINILNSFVWKPPFVPDWMDDILNAALAQHTGEKAYPGDAKPSPNWPTVAPGQFGPVNALAPNYQTNPLGFCDVTPKPPILWIRGADDVVVSDTSMFDLGTLGQLGAVPGWPGAEVMPPQPMITQTRAALDSYAAKGGTYREEVLTDCGHSPYIEQPAAFNALLHTFITS
ncbi:MAG: alpha/beta fold hydrolase [Pseudomonadota bacterium]